MLNSYERKCRYDPHSTGRAVDVKKNFGNVHFFSMSRRLYVAAPGLLFSQNQIQYPAPARMVPRLAAVVQNAGIRASGFFQGVCKDREKSEVAVIVDGLREHFHGGIEPGGIDGNRPKRVAEDVAHQEDTTVNRGFVIQCLKDCRDSSDNTGTQ
jgi:hypothetical protein